MRAAVLYEFGEAMKVEEVELAAARQGEVRVRLAASGVCHSDLSIKNGILPMPPPVIIGHEGAGVVKETGPGVTSVKPGDHVILTWMYPCGRCRDCGRGRPQHCEAALNAMAQAAMLDGTTRFTAGGEPMRHWVGTFAEETIVPEQGVVRIRQDVPLDRAALVGCAVMTGVGAVLNTAKVQPGDAVAVFGCGGVGLNVIQAAALAGAERIIAVDLLPAKLELARTFGATDVVNGRQADAGREVRGLTAGKGVDFAFEVVGSAELMAEAFGTLRRGGALVAVGVPGFGTQVTLPAFSFSLEEKAVIGSYYGSPRFHYDMPRILDLYMAGRLKLDELVSRRLGLDEINTAFALMEEGEVARSLLVY